MIENFRHEGLRPPFEEGAPKGVDAQHKVINRQSAISPEAAARLEKAVGGSADAWLRMPPAYDLAKVRRREGRFIVRRLAPPAT